MRTHLLVCIKNGNLTPFPSECVRRSRPVIKKKVEIHCDCRLPESVPSAADGTTNPASQSLTEFLNLTIEMTGFVVIATLDTIPPSIFSMGIPYLLVYSVWGHHIS